MFEALTKGFRSARNRLAGVAELDEGNIDEALRDVRSSLLEADVEFRVTKAFLERVKQKALGETVKVKARVTGRRMALGPGEHFVRICQQELVALMGPVDGALEWAKKGPTAFMLVGLQGSGKTTTIAKLARHLEKTHKKRPLLVAADVYRPAAIEQLKVLGQQLELPVYAEEGGNPVDICEHALRFAFEKGRDAVLLDTAGRLTIDEPLMNELSEIKARVRPHNIFLVCDAMIGQDAVSTAKAFNERLDLTGVILTKLDGDARGGAALSIKEVTGKPIKFVGMGEAMDRLEEFRPEGMASRILGMGDIVGLIKDFEEVVEEEQAAEDAVRMLRGKFDMNDFLEQIRVLKKMSGGGLGEVIEKMGLFPDGMPQGMNVDDRELGKMEAIIRSMTPAERARPEMFFTAGAFEGRRRREEFDLARVKRVARGSGRKEAEIREMLTKFKTMKQMMMTLGAQTGLLGKIPGLKQVEQMRQMKQMMGIDMGKFMEVAGLRAPALERRTFRPPSVDSDRVREKRKRKETRKARKKNRR
ncbi:MAG: signal recognition particle protein [Myxococcota bacterium]